MPTRKMLIAALALAGGVLAAPAAAQQASSRSDARVEVNRRMNSVFTRDGEQYEVTIDGDEVRVTRNGRAVENPRVEESPEGGLRVYDADGNVLLSITPPPTPPAPFRGRSVPPAPPAPPSWGGVGGAGGVEVGGQVMGFEVVQDDRPRIGITMGEVPEALRHHLNLGEGQGILVGSVMEGLPAARAGLQQHDIIVGVNGQRNPTGDQLREAVQNAQPGESIALDVRRGDRSLTIKVEPERVSGPQTRVFRMPSGSGAWSGGVPPMPPVPPPPPPGLSDEVSSALDELERSLDEVLGQIQDQRLAERARSAFTRLEESLQSFRSGPLGRGLFTPQDDGSVVFSFPGAAAGGWADFRGLHEMMERQMSHLVSQLEAQAQEMARRAEEMALRIELERQGGAQQPAPGGAQDPSDAELERRIERLLREREQRRENQRGEQREQPARDAGVSA